MKPRILFVDDINEWCKLIKKQLDKNYHVDTANSLKQALYILGNADPYHLVITDIGLSSNIMNDEGVTLVKYVHEAFPDTQLIAYSGAPRTFDLEKFQTEYHVLKFLDRRVFYDQFDEFLAWVAKGIELSLTKANYDDGTSKCISN